VERLECVEPSGVTETTSSRQTFVFGIFWEVRECVIEVVIEGASEGTMLWNACIGSASKNSWAIIKGARSSTK
jgi:hypothetical protein